MTMKQIKINEKDYEFLKDLQHELNTQENDGTANPLYWGVMETETVGAPEGCGEAIIYMDDGGTMSTEEAVKLIEEELLEDFDEEIHEEWNENVDKESMDDVVSFMNNYIGWRDVRIVWLEQKEVISRETGAFLTKRACKEYIERYGYNHTNPHTYAMCAYRNFELERLLKILKTIKL